MAALPNRAGEPDFQLKIVPEAVTFYCADKKPVWCDVKLTNTTKDRQSFKVKCTSADIFRVQPPLGFIKADETLPIRIWFQNKAIPEGQKHYFAIYHVKAADEKVAIKDIWTKTAKPDGVKRIGATFDKGAVPAGAAGTGVAGGAPAAAPAAAAPAAPAAAAPPAAAPAK